MVNERRRVDLWTIQMEYSISEKMQTERRRIWHVLSLIRRFLTPSATITLNVSRSQQSRGEKTPGRSVLAPPRN